MKHPVMILALALLAGCSGQEANDTPTADTAPAATAAAPTPAPAAGPEPSAPMDPAQHAAMGTAAGDPAAADTGAPAMGMGVVKAVDTAAGKVTLDHGPIESLKWPAMTMAFNATPEQLGSIKVGDKVHFEFTQQGGASTISKLTPAN